MTEPDKSREMLEKTGSFWKSRTGIVLLGFLIVAGLLLVYEHRLHIFTGNGLLIALLGACIGMHLFMHGGHGKRDDGDTNGGGGGR